MVRQKWQELYSLLSCNTTIIILYVWRFISGINNCLLLTILIIEKYFLVVADMTVLENVTWRDLKINVPTVSNMWM